MKQNVADILGREESVLDTEILAYVRKLESSSPRSRTNKCKVTLSRKLREIEVQLKRIQPLVDDVTQIWAQKHP
jgi:hypothetical protein